MLTISKYRSFKMLAGASCLAGLLMAAPVAKADTIIQYNFDGVSFPDALTFYDSSSRGMDLLLNRAAGIAEESPFGVKRANAHPNRSANLTKEDALPYWSAIQNADGKIPPLSAFTVEAWVKPKDFGTGSELWVLRSSDEKSRIMLGYDEKGAANGMVSGPDGEWKTLHDPAAKLPLNEWSHLALVYEDTTVRLFLNGEQIAEVHLPEAILFEISQGGLFGGDRSFNGLCDDFRLSDVALPAEELGFRAPF